mmetsp:Transcript_6775/g.17458  ORF Transcript_6775/g.17458 Transcript_6775/m.17458 type:complete len:420 (+) Transcript_6775:401-1660(+)
MRITTTIVSIRMMKRSAMKRMTLRTTIRTTMRKMTCIPIDSRCGTRVGIINNSNATPTSKLSCCAATTTTTIGGAGGVPTFRLASCSKSCTAAALLLLPIIPSLRSSWPSSSITNGKKRQRQAHQQQAHHQQATQQQLPRASVWNAASVPHSRTGPRANCIVNGPLSRPIKNDRLWNGCTMTMRISWMLSWIWRMTTTMATFPTPPWPPRSNPCRRLRNIWPTWWRWRSGKWATNRNGSNNIIRHNNNSNSKTGHLPWLLHLLKSKRVGTLKSSKRRGASRPLKKLALKSRQLKKLALKKNNNSNNKSARNKRNKRPLEKRSDKPKSGDCKISSVSSLWLTIRTTWIRVELLWTLKPTATSETCNSSSHHHKRWTRMMSIDRNMNPPRERPLPPLEIEDRARNKAGIIILFNRPRSFSA